MPEMHCDLACPAYSAALARCGAFRCCSGGMLSLQVLTGLSAAEVVKAISAPLSACIKGFPVPDSLHPFEAALLDLTIGMEAYQRRLNRVADMRRACVEVCPALASSIASPSAVADTTPSP